MKIKTSKYSALLWIALAGLALVICTRLLGPSWSSGAGRLSSGIDDVSVDFKLPLSLAPEALKLWQFVNQELILGVCQDSRSISSSIASDDMCAWPKCYRVQGRAFSLDPARTLAKAMAEEAERCPDYPVPSPAAETSIHVSFIIATHNNDELASKAILHLWLTSKEARSVEFVVIDDASSQPMPKVKQVLKRLSTIFGARVIFRHLDVSLGFGGANTLGVNLASGEFIAFINTDCYVLPGWLSTLLATFDLFPRAGIVGPMFVGENYLVTEAGGFVYGDGSPGNYARGRLPGSPYLYARHADYISAACVIMRRQTFHMVGGFDPRYAKGYFEDTDLAMKMRMFGLEVVYQPTAVVYHQEGHTLGTDKSSLKQQLMAENSKLFYNKWESVLKARHLPRSAPQSAVIIQQYRGHLLWIDDIVPEPDHDSGSIRTAALLQILVHAGYHVAYQPTASRDRKYTVHSRTAGVYVLDPRPAAQWNLVGEHGQCMYDAIIIARRYVFAAAIPVVQAQCPGVPIIYDTVDLHFLRESRDTLTQQEKKVVQSKEILHWLSSSSAPKDLVARRDEELSYVDASAVTLVVSPVEVEVIKHYRPSAQVLVVSNIHNIRPTTTTCEQRSGLLFVGNFNHKPNNQALNWFVSEVFPRLLVMMSEEQKRGFAFNIVGANNDARVRETLSKFPSEHINFRGMLPQEDLDALLGSVRVSVAPLLSGAGVKGKVNQAMSAGVPVVATSIATEGMQLRNNVECLVADTPDAFARATLSLLSDCELWNRLVSNAFANIDDYFSPTVAAARLLAALGIAGL